MEGLIWSKYNFLIDSDKVGKVLFDSYTNALLRLNDSLWSDYL